MAQKVTSTDIKLALKEFHNGKPSYFITECKTCSTYFPDPQGLLKFDGLAITKSYTKPNIIGYEIKVSRNDFLQDNKWHLYLQYCNEFYFVVPKGLVKKEELPDHVGLIYFNPDTKALRTVKKALYRQIEEPVGVYKYIIFSRLEEDRIGETVHTVTVGYRWVIRETAFRYGLLDKYPLDRICRNEHLAKYKVMRLEAYDKRSERKNG